jgi:hypothetical protein
MPVVGKFLSEDYFKNYYGKGRPMTEENLIWDTKNFLYQLNPFIQKSPHRLSFVDLGAGTGLIVKRLREQGIDADGYEINNYALENAVTELIDKDITKPLDRRYDIGFANVFMYMTNLQIHKFFDNNQYNIDVLVIAYPFEGNNDPERINDLDVGYFNKLADHFGYMMYQINKGFIVFVRGVDVGDLPFK